MQIKSIDEQLSNNVSKEKNTIKKDWTGFLNNCQTRSFSEAGRKCIW